MTDKKGGVYVPIYLDWLDVTQDLTAEEKGRLIDAVVAYASGLDYDHLLTGGVRIAFRFLKGQVDRNREISAKRSKAASGDKSEAPESIPEQNGTNGNKTEQTGTKLPKEKEKEEDKEKENNKKSCGRFVPPTPAEVEAYCKERGNGIDGEHFVDYYAARNWVLSNGKKMSDWRAAVRTWEHNSRERATPSKAAKTIVAQQYTQRDYSGVQDEVQAAQDAEIMAYLNRGAG